VNAGGDLRTFGEEARTIHLRHPGAPQRLIQLIELHNAALATSSPCFTRCRCSGRVVSHLVARDGRTAITRNISVSVRARECWLADALTKVVLNAPDLAEAMLGEYGAEALVLTEEQYSSDRGRVGDQPQKRPNSKALSVSFANTLPGGAPATGAAHTVAVRNRAGSRGRRLLSRASSLLHT